MCIYLSESYIKGKAQKDKKGETKNKLALTIKKGNYFGKKKALGSLNCKTLQNFKLFPQLDQHTKTENKRKNKNKQKA